MPQQRRTSALAVGAFVVVGLMIGFLVQVARSSWGSAPLVPPFSLAATLVVIGGVLLGLGIALRRAVTRSAGRAVNPFHAVRLLAGARAGQFAGGLFAGFGGGLALQLLTRSVLPPADTWAPMVLVLVGGAVLLGCGIITELLCRVPPGDGDENTELEAGDQPA